MEEPYSGKLYFITMTSIPSLFELTLVKQTQNLYNRLDALNVSPQEVKRGGVTSESYIKTSSKQLCLEDNLDYAVEQIVELSKTNQEDYLQNELDSSIQQIIEISKNRVAPIQPIPSTSKNGVMPTLSSSVENVNKFYSQDFFLKSNSMEGEKKCSLEGGMDVNKLHSHDFPTLGGDMGGGMGGGMGGVNNPLHNLLTLSSSVGGVNIPHSYVFSTILEYLVFQNICSYLIHAYGILLLSKED